MDSVSEPLLPRLQLRLSEPQPPPPQLLREASVSELLPPLLPLLELLLLRLQQQEASVSELLLRMPLLPLLSELLPPQPLLLPRQASVSEERPQRLQPSEPLLLQLQQQHLQLSEVSELLLLALPQLLLQPLLLSEASELLPPHQLLHLQLLELLPQLRAVSEVSELLQPLPLLWREVLELLLPQPLLRLRLLVVSDLLLPPPLLLLLPLLEASEGLLLKLHLPAQASEDLEVKFLLTLFSCPEQLGASSCLLVPWHTFVKK